MQTAHSQRLDIQGLRMVAVLTVFANHLWHWPQGGFVGVDVFFVISGFLITGNLLRTAERTGSVSIRQFYWNRMRRILPAATVVLVVTYVVCALIFRPFRANQVGIDAVFAFFFMANWRFALEGTDYFRAAVTSVSPLQHYWSLSVEEQFYFFWPVLIVAISSIVTRRAWTHSRRMRVAGSVMAVLVAASMGWAIYQTATARAWAYFDTFARIWELGVGALLATAAGLLARTPQRWKPVLSWAGLGFIGASLLLIGDDTPGFPAPWTLLPVTGAALVIWAGIGGEPRYQDFLRNRVSTYIGDISYSLYLVHWPVIVLLATAIEPGAYFDICAVAVAFGLAIASYHFIENPLRRADMTTVRRLRDRMHLRPYRLRRSTVHAVAVVAVLLEVGLCAGSCASYGPRPLAGGTAAAEAIANARVPLGPYEFASSKAAAPPIPLPPAARTAAQPVTPPAAGSGGPLAAAFQKDLADALQATDWPVLDPPIESIIAGSLRQTPDIEPCAGTVRAGLPDPESCTWGSPSAPIRAVLIGDSVALNYAGALARIAAESGGTLQVRAEWMIGCKFGEGFQGADSAPTSDKTVPCPERLRHAIDVINTVKPDVVLVSHSYFSWDQENRLPEGWAGSVRQVLDTFRGSTKRLVLIAPPPADKKISECYGTSSSTPADCVSQVTSEWLGAADTQQSLGGTWIDSRPWFCSSDGLCPSFVGTTATKVDRVHMTPAYGQKIFPIMAESLRAAGVF